MRSINATSVQERPMTFSTKTHDRPAGPHHHRLVVAWLAGSAAWLRDHWAYAYRRGQLGPVPGEVRHDRRREVYDIMLPRIY
jgi:hypothetical protein